MKPLGLTICAMLLALSSAAFAIPAQRLWRTHKQSDGKEITYMLCGDEHCHYYMSADSFVLQYSSPFRAGLAKPPTLERKKDSSSSLNSTTSSFPGLTSKLYTTVSVT